MNQSRRTHHTARRGVIIPLLAILLPVLLLLLGFTVDLAHMQKTRAELRMATDSAARAAATTLARTDNRGQARRAAKRVAAANTIGGQGLTITNREIVFGRSEPSGDKYVFSRGTTPYNAVQITGLRTASSRDGAVPLYFGSLLGQTNFEPQFSAVASFINVDIVLVLDRSTSMKMPAVTNQVGMYTNDPRFCRPPYADSRWGALDAAVRVFTDTMRQTRAEECVGVVTYASDIGSEPVYQACAPYSTTAASTLDRSLTSNMNQVDRTLDSLMSSVWNGNTYIEAGMMTAIAELNSNARSTADKKMIVMTDGFENVGDATAAARAAAAAGIQVHAITFGDYADRVRLAEVARLGDGLYQHAPDSAALVEAFRKLASSFARLTE